MTLRRWPWEQDSRIDKVKRIADSYRTALNAVDPQSCHIVDARMVECGQEWVCGQVVNVDQLVTAQEAAAELGFSPVSVHAWARSSQEEIPVRGKRDGKSLYRLGDLIRYDALRDGE